MQKPDVGFDIGAMIEMKTVGLTPLQVQAALEVEKEINSQDHVIVITGKSAIGRSMACMLAQQNISVHCMPIAPHDIMGEALKNFEVVGHNADVLLIDDLSGLTATPEREYIEPLDRNGKRTPNFVHFQNNFKGRRR